MAVPELPVQQAQSTFAEGTRPQLASMSIVVPDLVAAIQRLHPLCRKGVAGTNRQRPASGTEARRDRVRAGAQTPFVLVDFLKGLPEICVNLEAIVRSYHVAAHWASGFLVIPESSDRKNVNIRRLTTFLASAHCARGRY
jgi:hypothetical protein